MSETLTDIDRRINHLWSNGRFTDACKVLASELRPAIEDHLVSRGLTREDAEDAAADAWHGFLKKITKDGPQSIAAPKPYLWKSALQRAIDYRKRSRKAPTPESQLTGTSDDPNLGPN